ncbi:hypothetical protein [Dyadobacter psychrotolerans]|uniref:Uncharacterized protein n=1 Tax=Dyadobacter psychrotolerans TaxID=2541721 RepID=A0A4R5DWZ6_9BACT|nr:hypothetical protein [Dyadobacter psychrotolerans]TDE18417.1 hypothetical protein E0F88_02450 [Dyadobacter psychrotolerans]
MDTAQTIPTRLSNLQMELLKLYSYNVSENELKEIQKLLANYFSKKIDTEMDLLWEDNNWSDETIESWKSEHLRGKPAL